MRARWWILAPALTLFGGALLLTPLCVGVIPDRALTLSDMHVTSVRIGEYRRLHGTMPPDLRALPEREGFVNRTTDAWGRPLLYSVDGDRFTLGSLGADGVPGGEGDDADLSETYVFEDGEAVPLWEEPTTTPAQTRPRRRRRPSCRRTPPRRRAGWRRSGPTPR